MTTRQHGRTAGMLIAGLLALCACQERIGNMPNVRRIEMNRTMPLDTNADAPVCKVVLDVAEISDGTESAKRMNRTIMQHAFGISSGLMEAAADSFCASRFSRYKEHLQPLYEADKRHNVNSAWYDYRYDVAATYELGRRHTLCYEITVTRYEGGAHDVTEYHCLNFDLSTGELVTLNDLYQPSYPGVLLPLLMKELQEQFDCNNLEALHRKGILRLTDLYIPGNYRLEEEGITFVYTPDEIASYETGTIRLTIPYGALAPLEKEPN